MTSWDKVADKEWSTVISGIELTITQKEPRPSAPDKGRYVLDSPDECIGEYPTRAEAEAAAENYGRRGGKGPKVAPA